MGSEKMTDIVVSTSAFIVTLSYPAKFKSTGINHETVLEVIPIVQSATKDIGLAEKFFDIICADSSAAHRRKKVKLLRAFIHNCPKKITEEFWDSSHWRTLEGLCLRIPSISCVLYDRAGSLLKEVRCSPIDILWSLQRVEEAFFITSGTPMVREEHAKKEFRRDQNRETHKYFLHHRAPR